MTPLTAHRLPSIVALALCLGGGALAQAPPAPLPAPDQIVGRIKIAKLADLPPHTYAVSGKAADFVQDDAKVSALAAQVEADTRHDLAAYDIEDATTLRGLYGTLATTAMLRRDYPAALAAAGKVRDLTDKPQEKLVSGLTLRALVAAQQAPGADKQKTLEADLYDALRALPYDQVQDSLKERKGSYEILSENLLLGGLSSGLDPVMATGKVSQEVAGGLLGAAFAERDILPNRAALLGAYTRVVNEHKTVLKPDIWPGRDITLAPAAKLHPVLVGIWDSGVDLNLYKPQLWTDKDGHTGSPSRSTRTRRPR